MAKITIYIPEQEPVSYDLGEEDVITIGRAPDCSIVVDDGSVSGHHAEIRKIGAGLHMLVDTNSTNGVFLEGEQISEAPLANGASITIGSIPAEFEAAEGEASAEAPAGAGLQEGGDSYGAPVAAIAESSNRPQGFKDMSPVEKVEKKDSISGIAMIVGTLAIVAAIVLVLMTVLMNVA